MIKFHLIFWISTRENPQFHSKQNMHCDKRFESKHAQGVKELKSVVISTFDIGMFTCMDI